jgi:hypothetical protein
MTQQLWKTNWAETQAHFKQWWTQKGLVLSSWGTGLPNPHAPHAVVTPPPAPTSPQQRHTDAQFVAHNLRYEMAHKVWPADIVPAAWADIGTVSLAPYLGALPEYAETNIWYQACITDPATHSPLQFDPAHPACQQLENIVRTAIADSQGNYFVGMPAIIPNLDVLAELRGAGPLMTDFVDRPNWVHAQLQAIEIAYQQAFNRMYELIKLPDGSMAFGYFMLWGPGKTGLLQCDVAAMISPRMFKKFVAPYLRQSCQFLDYAMFHVDGHQCLNHVDLLLEIEDLAAIEWTPDPQVPPGGAPYWYDLYRKILHAGKSVWVANIDVNDVQPLLDALGGDGLYLNVTTANGVPLQEADMAQLLKMVEPYRK